MPDSEISETTQLLRAWAGGNEHALGDLMPRVERELRRLAAHFLKNERPGHTLQATELVNEVYLRLIDINQMDWQHRAHFFALSATMMRRILMDHARRRLTAKRGAKPVVLDIEHAAKFSFDRSRELVALDDALNALASVDPRKARIVELRFFVGLKVDETAAVIGVSEETVMRDWKLARAWLITELQRA
jgi:RNA polymerase sigma-70 factor (ECF subfamily)